MTRTVLCPRCGCSHRTTEGEPCTCTNLCFHCLPATSCSALKIPTATKPKPPAKPKKRKAVRQ